MSDAAVLAQEAMMKAATDAIKRRHEYVTPDHVGYVMLGEKYVAAFVRRRLPDRAKCLAEARRLLAENLADGAYFTRNAVAADPRTSEGFGRLMAVFTTSPDPLVRIPGLASVVMLCLAAEEPESFTAWCLEEAGLPAQHIAEALATERDAMENSIVLCDNATELAKASTEVVVGRSDAVDQALLALARKSKNSVLFVGPSGAGKSAAARELVRRLATDGDALPPSLAGRNVWATTVSRLHAGLGLKTDFEETLSLVATAVMHRNGILYVDDVHGIVGTGVVARRGSAGADVVKPMLESGALPIIGTATDEEYRATIAKDTATDRLFAKVRIDALSVSDTKKALRFARRSYEKHHGVKVPAAAINDAAELAHAHVAEGALPDKAFDVLDMACAAAAMRSAKRDRNDAAKPSGRETVTLDDIALQVAKRAGIGDTGPDAVRAVRSATTAAGLKKSMLGAVFGQDNAVQTLCDAVLVSRSGLAPDAGTSGAFLFAGPTGTGKTETATQLARSLGVKLLKYDMSAYNEKHKVSSLIGAPPGYVGHTDGPGIMVADIKNHPDAVVLLDEIEKAHASVLDIFLQVLDKGTLRSASGESADFSKAIVIMTSNLGAEGMAKNAIGFGAHRDASHNHDAVMAAVKRHFRPEFRNRIDAIVQFDDLPGAVLRKIVAKKVREMNAAGKKSKVRIRIMPDATAWIAEKGKVEAMGARPIDRLLHRYVTRRVAREMAGGRLASGGTAVVSMNAAGTEPDVQFEPAKSGK